MQENKRWKNERKNEDFRKLLNVLYEDMGRVLQWNYYFFFKKQTSVFHTVWLTADVPLGEVSLKQISEINLKNANYNVTSLLVSLKIYMDMFWKLCVKGKRDTETVIKGA